MSTFKEYFAAKLRELGKAGGKARAKSLTPKQRSAIARMGGLAKSATNKKRSKA